MKLFALNALEDLWHDYLYFKKQAETYFNEGRMLHHKRYLRAALLSLISYLEGITSKWCVDILVEENKSNKQIQEIAERANIDKKCDFLIQKVAEKSPSISKPSITSVKRLRNKIVHAAGIGSNNEVFMNLNIDMLNKAEKEIVSWLDSLGTVLGRERHESTENILDDFSELGETITDEYSGEGLE